jgi:cation-transporting ATPase E
VPAGLVTAATVLAGYGIVRGLTGASLEEARTASTLLLLAVALWILLVLMEPVDRTDGLILGSMTALAVLIVATPIGRRFYALDLLPLGDALLLAGYGLAVLVGLIAGLRIWRGIVSRD